MKTRVFLLLVTFAFMSTSAKAQRGVQIGYVDMEYILAHVPEYQEATDQLDKKVQQWKEEIALKRKAIEAMRQTLENERPLLTKELIEERLAEIAFQEEKLLEYQQKRFGPGGALIVLKRRLIKPVQDQIFSAVQEIGKTRQYDFIFENSSDALMLYAANRHDISDRVLGMIQRSARENARANRKEEEKAPEPYKSVKKAAKDRQAAAARQAELDRRKRERKARIEARQKERDSIEAVRQAAYEARRAARLKEQKERERKRDSLMKAREARRNNLGDEN